MTTNAAQFTGEIPKNYDEHLGPVIFAPYADDIAARAKALGPQTLLELAAGTGRVTRVLRDLLPEDTAITATDLNDAMLEIARPLFEGGSNVSFEVVDAMSLPQDDESFDAIVCQFGVMFFPDKVASYREALRVLKPGGTYLFNAWDSWDSNPWAGLLQETVQTFFEAEAPGFYKVPFHYHDPAEIKRDLEAAGFTNVTVERVEKTGQVASLEGLAYAAVYGNPLADEIRASGMDVSPDAVVEAIEAALTDRFGVAPTTIPLAAFIASGEKPS